MKIENLIEALEEGLEDCKAHPSLKGVELCYELMIKYHERIVETAARENSYLAAIGGYTPVELLYAMDIVPFHLEMYAINVTFMSGCEPLLDAAAGYGIPTEVCSAQRASIGLAVSEAIPRPDLVINTALVCDPAIKTFEIISKRYQCPTFFLDQPYLFNESGVKYYKKELENLIAFLEVETKQKLDWQRLEETLELSRQAANLYREASELRKAVPTPMRNIDFFNHCMIYIMFAGTPEAVSYFELIRDEAREIVEGKKGPLREKEKHRLLCLFGFPAFSMDLLDWMEKDRGVTIVMDGVSAWVREGEIDPSRPLESLAQKMNYWPMAVPFCGPIENWSDMAVKVGKEYQADGAILLAPIGCQQSCAAIRAVRDALKDHLGIPSLLADCDVIDPSVVSAEELKTKFEGFFEMLEGDYV